MTCHDVLGVLKDIHGAITALTGDEHVTVRLEYAPHIGEDLIVITSGVVYPFLLDDGDLDNSIKLIQEVVAVIKDPANLPPDLVTDTCACNPMSQLVTP